MRLRAVGTVGVIRQMAKGPAAIQIVVEGLVARADHGRRADGQRPARRPSRCMPDDETRELEVDAYIQRLRELSDRALSFASGLPQDLKALVAGIDSPLRLCYVIASMLDMKGDDKQQLLEEERLVDEAAGGRQGAVARSDAARAEGQDRVRGPAGDERRAARVLPAPAAEGDPRGTRRHRRRRVAASSPSASSRRTCPSTSRKVADREVEAPGADDAGVARVPDDPHVPRLAARGAVVGRRPTIGSTPSRRAACSTRTTTTSTA